MKQIDKLIRDAKKRTGKRDKPLNKICTLALGLSSGSIKWGDSSFKELIEGDLMEKVGAADGPRKKAYKT